MLEIANLVKLLPAAQIHRLALALGQLEIILRYFQRSLSLSELLALSVELNQELVTILRERRQSIYLVLESFNLLRIGGLLARVELSLL